MRRLPRLIDGGRWTRRDYTALDTSITVHCDTVPHTAIKSAVRSRNLYYLPEVSIRSISAYYGVFLLVLRSAGVQVPFGAIREHRLHLLTLSERVTLVLCQNTDCRPLPSHRRLMFGKG